MCRPLFDLFIRAALFGAVIAVATPFARAQASGAAEVPGIRIEAANGERWMLPTTATDIQVEIAGLVAHTTLSQRFENPRDAFLNGQYRLPLPEGAAVHAMHIELNGRVIEGEIREREAARIEFEAAKAAGMATALVDQDAATIFKTRIANIPPHDQVTVTLSFVQTLTVQDGRFEYVMPLSIRPKFAERPAQDLGGLLDAANPATETGLTLPASLSVNVRSALPLQRPLSPSHAIESKAKRDGFTISLKDKALAADRDFVLWLKPQPGTEPRIAAFQETGPDGATYVSVMMVPPTQAPKILPRELILVIDSSGSMLGPAFDGTQLAARFALESLNEADFVNVIDFDDAPTAFQSASVPADRGHVDAARQFIDGLAADGGTNIADAIELAMQLPAVPDRVRQIVLITDGAVGNEHEIYQRMLAVPSEARLFMVGIGNAPNRAFLRHAAALGHGSSQIIENSNAVNEPLQALFLRMRAPILSKVQLQWPALAEAYPEQIPDLASAEPLWLSARLAGKAEGDLQIKAWSAQGAYTQTALLSVATPATGLSKIWAQKKIASLEDAELMGADAKASKAAIIETGLTHHLASRYTSFVAVEKVVRNEQPDATAETQFDNPLPADAVAFANTALGWKAWLALGLLLLLLSQCLRPSRV